MDMTPEEEPEWKPFGFHSDDYDTPSTPLTPEQRKGPQAMRLLDRVEDYLKAFRPSPQRDRLLKDIAALKAGA